MLKKLNSKRQLSSFLILCLALCLAVGSKAVAIELSNVGLYLNANVKSYESKLQVLNSKYSNGSQHSKINIQSKAWVLANGKISEDRAIQIAQSQVSGKVLGVRLDPQQQVYHVKILSSDAKVQVVKVDANTGGVVR